jgi:hypothetical protein
MKFTLEGVCTDCPFLKICKYHDSIVRADLAFCGSALKDYTECLEFALLVKSCKHRDDYEEVLAEVKKDANAKRGNTE